MWTLLDLGSVPMLESMFQDLTPKLWVQPVSMACDVANVAFTKWIEGGMPPLQKWMDAKCDLRGNHPFDTLKFIYAIRMTAQQVESAYFDASGWPDRFAATGAITVQTGNGFTPLCFSCRL